MKDGTGTARKMEATGTRPQEATRRRLPWSRLTSTLRRLLCGTGETGTRRSPLAFRDIGPLVLPCLDEGEMARAVGGIHRRHPGLRILTIRPSALAAHLKRPTPPEAVRLLTTGSCWPEVLFFEVPNTTRHGGGRDRGTFRVHVAASHATHYPEFDLFSCPCGDYSIFAIDTDGRAYVADGINF